MEYTQNLGLCFLYGIVFKIYDDIIDNKLNVSAFYVNLLKYFVITLFSIIFYNDIIFSILWFSMAFVSFLLDKYYTNKLAESKDTVEQKDFTCMNEDTWLYSLILSGIFIIYHGVIFFVKNQQLDFNLFSYKNITFFINLLINIAIVTLDIYFTPEHSSNKKLYARIVVLMLLCIFVYYMIQFSEYIYEGNYGIMLMNIGFLLGSVCFLTLDKIKAFDYLKNKEKEQEQK
jgi:fatty acid desaturase